MTGQTIGTFGTGVPTIEAEWNGFKTRVVDRTIKMCGGDIKMFGDLGPMIIRMLHDSFYAGALTMFAIGTKGSEAEKAALAGEVEAYYQAALRQAADGHPPV